MATDDSSGGDTPGKGSAGLMASTLSGARVLFLVRTFQRLLTFALNQALLRSTSPDVFGFAAIELELLLATVLFLSREGVRLALLRSAVGVGAARDVQARAVNLSWASVPLGCVVATATGAFFLWTRGGEHSADADGMAHARAAVLMYCAGAVLETVAEPAFIMSQNHLLYKLRGTLEMVAMLGRCGTTYALVVAGYGAAAFGVAQVVFALVLVLGYYGYFWVRAGSPGFPVQRFQDLLPGAAAGSSSAGDGSVLGGWLDGKQVSMAFVFTQQSLFKHLLTQGDKIVLTLASSLFNQGVYAVVTNYGSLVVRLLFQPLEEVSRTLFAKLQQQAAPAGDKHPRRAAAARVLRAFLVMVRLVVIVGLVIAALGSNYCLVLVHLLLGSKWSSTEVPSVLAWFCVYVLALAVNGMTEALVVAVADKKQLNYLNKLMVLVFAGYAGLALLLLQWVGTAGIVLASTAHMIARIVASFTFLRGYFSDVNVQFDLLSIFPSAVSCSAFGVAYCVTLGSRLVLFPGVGLRTMALHVLVGACAFAAVVFCLWRYDGRVISMARALRAGKFHDE